MILIFKITVFSFEGFLCSYAPCSSSSGQMQNNILIDFSLFVIWYRLYVCVYLLRKFISDDSLCWCVPHSWSSQLQNRILCHFSFVVICFSNYKCRSLIWSTINWGIDFGNPYLNICRWWQAQFRQVYCNSSNDAPSYKGLGIWVLWNMQLIELKPFIYEVIFIILQISRILRSLMPNANVSLLSFTF